MSHVASTAALLLLLLPFSAARGQDPDATVPTMAQAAAKLQQQDWEGAADLYERIVEVQPQNAQAWHLLGYCLHAARHFDRALVAHEKAATFPQTTSGASYNAACAHAVLGHDDQAFEWLRLAFAAGFQPQTPLRLDPDLAGLLDDPRMAEFLPPAPDSKEPFVEENVAILHDVVGEAAGDQFGWVARNVGDCDCDGAADFASTAPFHGAGGSGVGAVYVYSGKSGELLFKRSGQPGENLGWSVAAAGDVDGDGHADVIAGGPGVGNLAGAAYVWSGKDGSLIKKLVGDTPGDRFGQGIACVGDLDGDGRPDLALGAPKHDAAGADAGRVSLVSGADWSVLATLDGERAGDGFGSDVAGRAAKPDDLLVVAANNAGEGQRGCVYAYTLSSREERFRVEAEATGQNLGWFLSIVGDVDADGLQDVYLTDWQDGAKGGSTGRAFVHSGKDGARLLEWTGAYGGEGFGIGVGDAGDVNGDGHDDLVIGAWTNRDGAQQGGKIYLCSGKDGAQMGAFTGAISGDTLGFDATGLGDVDGDGVLDLLVTSAWNACAGPKTGRIYVVSASFALPAERAEAAGE